jgi:hypothetical protein
MLVFNKVHIIEAWMLEIVAGPCHYKAHHFERRDKTFVLQVTALREILNCLKRNKLVKGDLLRQDLFHGCDCDR